ncbi:MAG: helix-turn-helix domain-containing protein [Nitriliruptoraceae bacterium]
MSSTERSTSPQVRKHRALASPVRARLIEVLRDEPDLDAGVLASRLDLHINTIRSHLNLLEEAGLVMPVAEERDRPGRPRLLYRVSEQGQDDTPVAEDRGYRFLAGVLASYLGATTEDTEAAAERAGSAWGSFVVDKPAPFAEITASDGLDRLVAMLEEFGFAPELDDQDPEHPQLLLRRCPFLDVAREHPDVVCSVHLGLMRGALDELGVDVHADDLLPWAQPDGCVSHLQVGASNV